jgi:hypothetical protein
MVDPDNAPGTDDKNRVTVNRQAFRPAVAIKVGQNDCPHGSLQVDHRQSSGQKNEKSQRLVL